jgi:hypothetical protein
MPTSQRAQRTDFSVDISGRYTSNGLEESRASLGAGARPFDLLVVGGGSFSAALAQQLFANDQAKVHHVTSLREVNLLFHRFPKLAYFSTISGEDCRD